jgi:hypothetical protein
MDANKIISDTEATFHFNVNLANMQTVVKVIKREDPHDPMPRYDVIAKRQGIVIGSNLTLAQVRRLCTEKGYEIDLDEN